jgi:hypothetical protein
MVFGRNRYRTKTLNLEHPDFISSTILCFMKLVKGVVNCLPTALIVLSKQAISLFLTFNLGF